LGEGALLEYLPDPLIPFEGARYVQQTRIELAEGAGLFWWEVVAPGREARPEVFRYELLRLDLDIRAGGKLVAQERVRLEPLRRPLSSPVRLGEYRYFATFYVCRVGLPSARWLEMEKQLAELARQLSLPAEILWGVSALVAHGLVIRAVSRKGRAITPGLMAFWQAAKRQLYARDAVPPRKVN
jgi:urease accessory protein